MRDKKGIKGKEGESDRIRVYVRVRPRSVEETSRSEALGVEVEPEKSEVALNDAKERRYKFDTIFTPEASNKEVSLNKLLLCPELNQKVTLDNRKVFNTVGRPLLDAVFSGFNGTLMAYGQTGTGKTFTMMSSDGICVAAVKTLFRRIHLDTYHGYKVCMSYLQIYQEKIYDLLNPDSKVDLVLREDPKKGVYVENLSEFVVRDTCEVLSLLKTGKKKLIFGETRMNRFSSRSHSVCQITVERWRAKHGADAGASNDCSHLSSGPPRVSCKPVRSTGSLDRLHEKSKIPLRTRSTPSKVGTSRLQTFAPRKTSTPHPTGSLSRVGAHRHSLHLSSLPEVTASPIRPNRWSMGELMPSGFLGSSDSLPNSPTGSEGSDLLLREDFFELESGSESEGWKGPDSPDIPEFDLGDGDDDETFLEDIRIHEDVLITGRINICDLAGSERIKKSGVEGGERLSELQTVNLSLLELGNTIHALSEGKRTHVPYRNSTLTRLLQDSLGGNCKTSFVMCISPLLRDVTESRCTLDFGQRALKITTTAYVNVEVDYVKLSEDLRKKVEIQDLEIKAQRENFEKQNYAIKSDAEAKVAELEALVEAERDRFSLEIKTLQLENEKLSKTLFDEISQRRTVEGRHRASLETALLTERERIISDEETEKRRLQNALEEERRRSSTSEQRAKEEFEQALEEEKQRSRLLKELQREELEKSLQQERQRISELETRLSKSPSRERYTQTMMMLDEPEFPRISPANNQTDTLYNVLLAEIMSLQLLYQMQDLSRACSVDDPQSRDSGCPEYDDVVIQSVSSSVLEKGGLLLNNLRGRQRGDSRFSLTSTGSLRELYLLQFPPSPKLCQRLKKPGLLSMKGSCPELRSDSKKSFSSTDSEVPRAQDGVSSSSMESFLEDEPMSPRSRCRPSDSGCSSQHSDSERASGARQHSQPIEITGRARASSNPVKCLNASACVPLAEEEVEELDIVDGPDADEIESVKNKVVHLEGDLCRLKMELDSETVNFFSEVFGVDVPFPREEELSRVMRHLFESVKEKLLQRICGHDQEKLTEEEEGYELDLNPPVLEEAVNLLLVSKTVMSCLLVLQNRRDAERNQELSNTELPTVIHVQPKVDEEVQTDPEPIRSLRRRVRKDTGMVTDPQVKVEVLDKECQTRESRENIVPGPAVIPAYQEEHFEPVIKPDQWLSHCDSDLEELGFHDDSDLLQVRDPDGASGDESPGGMDDIKPGASLEEDSETMLSAEDVDLKDAKRSKMRYRLLSCIRPARLSVRRKPKKGQTKKSDTTHLVKEI